VGDPVLFQHLFLEGNYLNTVKMSGSSLNFRQLENNKIYSKYYELNSKLYGKKKQPDPKFLTWLIGFSEGDGCFTIATRGDLYFVITQDTRDIQVLEYIKKELNMGKVIKQGKTTSRFIIQDLLGLYLIALIFNGQIRTPDKLKSFNKFVNKLNEKIDKGTCPHGLRKFGYTKEDNLLKKLNINTKPKNLTLNDNWFAGFTDAEGCFHAHFNKNNNGYNILFDITQKGKENKEFILDKLSVLFGVGKVSRHYHENNWRYRVSGMINLEEIISYFNKEENMLYTKKYNSYFLWKYIHSEVKKKNHLYLKKRLKLMNLAQTVNKYTENVGKN
jgi:hypothetical protein